jgi:pantoate--beta-alanine ligase
MALPEDSSLPEVETVATTTAVRELVARWRAARETVALVPTMGNLHRGHMSLAQLARRRADRVMMTIFVNPTQFGAGEDFESYPRTLDDDSRIIRAAGCVDALFAPQDSEIYPFGIDQSVRLAIPAMSGDLCGAHRPGHFDGVLTVVVRLLNIVQPDVLVLGRKDYQQLKLIERMVADLQMPVSVVGGPIEREADGLALSSRNRYLSAAERRVAPRLHEALELTAAALQRGEVDYERLSAQAAERLAAAGFNVDYVEIRAARDLSRPTVPVPPEDLIVLAAAWLGRARLIDNVPARQS